MTARTEPALEFIQLTGATERLDKNPSCPLNTVLNTIVIYHTTETEEFNPEASSLTFPQRNRAFVLAESISKAFLPYLRAFLGFSRRNSVRERLR